MITVTKVTYLNSRMNAERYFPRMFLDPSSFIGSIGQIILSTSSIVLEHDEILSYERTVTAFL